MVGRFLSDNGNDFEILLVIDDPSFDVPGSLGALASDERVRVLANSTNLGLTRSLIRGVNEARGKIIIRNDDDDLPSGSRLARVREHFVRYPDTDLVFSFANGLDEAGNRWSIEGPTEQSAIVSLLKRKNFIVASSVAYRRELVVHLGNYNPLFRYAQDYELYLRFSRAGARFACIDVPLVDRMYSPNSITVQKRKTQMLYSFAARLIHAAELKDVRYTLATILQYVSLYITPQWMRKLRRRLGLGR
ncbi:glycosyltransferase [Rhizobium sp. XQZ8]|nr:glycosyltransferase [Rhizobium populisoli]